MIVAWLALAGPALIVLPGGPSQPQQLHAHVDPRVELMSIIFRLAGNPEYNHRDSKSPYAGAVEAHFGRFRSHPVVQAAQRLRAERGISYDAVTSIAVHVEDAVGLKEKIPFTQSPPRLDKRWRPPEAREFLEKARDFAQDTGFSGFFETHRALYDAAAIRLSATLNERATLNWFDSFFGARPDAKFDVIVGMLYGPNCNGVAVRYPQGREEIIAVLGAWQFDAQGIPVFDDDLIIPIFVHELCHSYVNPLVDHRAKELEPAGTRLFAHCRAAMEQQAYGTWQIMLYESLVRACVIRHQLAHDGRDAARRAAKEEYQRGFHWIGGLVKLLGEYERNRGRYTTFADVMPRVVEFFNAYADEYESQMARAPKVVSMIPTNGATDVDPNLRAITITFDQPMMDKSWSLCGGGENYPKIAGELSYDKECKVLAVPVRLKPGWTYHFGINCPSYRNFKSRTGVSLEPLEVTFKTRPQ